MGKKVPKVKKKRTEIESEIRIHLAFFKTTVLDFFMMQIL